MMLSTQRVALSLTAATAILYSICSLGYAVIASPTMALSQAVFHGMLGPASFTFGSYFVGLVTLSIVTYIGGFIHAWFYNLWT